MLTTIVVLLALLLPSTTPLSLPKHPTNSKINDLLAKTAQSITSLQPSNFQPSHDPSRQIFANSYVDMSKITTIGFDFDYTLLQYNDKRLLPLIYSLALKKLTNSNQYPTSLLKNLTFDPHFAVRGLAVDLKTGWVCQLSYTHKVAVAYYGREKVSRNDMLAEFEGRRALTPAQRIQRLKPLNDLFSMAECCLVADVIEAFRQANKFDFYAKSVVEDVLRAIRDVHLGGEFHKLVADDPEQYFKKSPETRQILQNMVAANKKLLLISNSPYWYVNAGMKYVVGDDWLSFWDATIVLSGKPTFFREKKRPFREVDTTTNNSMLFTKITHLEKNKIYTEGCLSKLISLMPEIFGGGDDVCQIVYTEDGGVLNAPNVLYVGDSLFADLVDAKREFGWTTAAIISELKDEVEFSISEDAIRVKQTIALLLSAMRKIQTDEYLGGGGCYSGPDSQLLDELENIVSVKRDELATFSGNQFGSVFRARHELSHYSASLRRFADVYMPSIEAMLNYSPDHRFYPNELRSASHEVELDSLLKPLKP